MVLSKPVGWLSQGSDAPAGTVPNVVDALRARWGRPFVGLIHRLDRNTSGVMVVAQRTKSASRLTASLQSGELRRTYLAWVHGVLRGHGSWEHLLQKDPQSNRVHVLRDRSSASHSGRLPPQPARLRFESLTTVRRGDQECSLVRFDLDTGRSHQIRAQAAAEGHPLLGDLKYGGPPHARLGLHSWKLEFPYPVGESRRLYFCDDLPQELDPAFLTKR